MSDYSFENKPSNWNTLPLFKKVRFTMKNFNRNFSRYVDKLEAKKIVEDICGDSVKVTKTVRVLNNPNDLSEKDLNSNYIIKGAHGCDFNINIKPNKKYYVSEMRERIHGFNKIYSTVRERQYSYLKPRFFIEEKIEDKIYGKNGDAVCYMLRCIHGVPYTFSPYLKCENLERHYIFNKDKTVTPIIMNYKKLGHKFYDIKKAQIGEKNIERMYDLAGKLSKDFEFVRIDFYLGKNDDIYFSEFTFSPARGAQNYPMELENKLGKLWK